MNQIKINQVYFSVWFKLRKTKCKCDLLHVNQEITTTCPRDGSLISAGEVRIIIDRWRGCWSHKHKLWYHVCFLILSMSVCPYPSVCLSCTPADCWAVFQRYDILPASNPFSFQLLRRSEAHHRGKAFEEDAEWERARTLLSLFSQCLVSFLFAFLSVSFDKRKDPCVCGPSHPTSLRAMGLPLTPIPLLSFQCSTVPPLPLPPPSHASCFLAIVPDCLSCLSIMLKRNQVKIRKEWLWVGGGEVGTVR